jgi:cyclic 2,3-diphosphoglycerate synthetase
MKVLALVDGEHYPPVTRWGLATARSRGHEVVAALLLGGKEKLAAGDEPPDLGVPVRVVPPGVTPRQALEAAILELRPEAVLDLSDEPVVGYRERFELASVSLIHRVPYLGSDFRLDPPILDPPLPVPTVAVIGTGKRTGKTAVAGELARVAAARGLDPVMVAMGRGGPGEPQVAEAGSVTLETLKARVAAGDHAASDYLEDALFTGVTTVGARRVGGGLAGAPYASNVREAAKKAVELGAGVVILEGSGAAVPPVPWDAGILVSPAATDPELVGGYMGPFRVLLCDLFVATMASDPVLGSQALPASSSHVRRLRPDARFVETDFEPHPLGDVRGRTVYLTTTAPEPVAERQAKSIEDRHGCRVVGWSTRLADRAGLAGDIERAEAFELLLTELKAAAVDVAAEAATSRGAGVVFVDNRPVPLPGQPDLRSEMERVLALAAQRHRARTT